MVPPKLVFVLSPVIATGDDIKFSARTVVIMPAISKDVSFEQSTNLRSLLFIRSPSKYLQVFTFFKNIKKSVLVPEYLTVTQLHVFGN